MAGLTDAGFERKTLPEIIDSLKQEAKNTFGTDFNTNDDSIAAQLIGVFAIELDEVWQGLEGAYSAYTLNGAEGVYLDDLFSRHNIIRLPATAGTGSVLVESDSTTTLPQTIPTSTTFTASNNIEYNPQVETTIDTEFTSAYKILAADISTSTSYTIYCEDANGVIQSTVLSTTDEASKGTFVTNVKTFVDSTNASLSSKTQAFAGEYEFYLGFNGSKQLDPLDSEVEFYTDPVIGNRYTTVLAEAAETGFNPLKSGGITALSPEFTGFVSVTNLTSFNSGTNVETDAEFRARFNRLIDASANGSDRQSMESALIGLDGVTDARIYENPTASVDGNGVQPYSYMSVVAGGNTADISQLLFDQGPVNVLTDGSTSAVINTTAGSPITVKYQPAQAVDISVRITATTANAIDLNSFEKQEITNAIVNLALNFGIGSTVYLIQITSAVVSSLSFGRLTSLLVEIDSGGGFAASDFTAAFDELPQIQAADISFL